MEECFVRKKILFFAMTLLLLTGITASADVLGEQKIARVPLAPKEVAGSLNLRGRIVTAFDVRTRLGAARYLGDASRSSPGTESAA